MKDSLSAEVVEDPRKQSAKAATLTEEVEMEAESQEEDEPFPSTLEHSAVDRLVKIDA